MKIELVNVEKDEVGVATALAFSVRKKGKKQVLPLPNGGELLVIPESPTKIKGIKLPARRYVFARMPNPYDELKMYVVARSRAHPRAVNTNTEFYAAPPPDGAHGLGYTVTTNTWRVVGWNGGTLTTHSGTRRWDWRSFGGGGGAYDSSYTNWSNNGFITKNGSGVGSSAGGESGSFTYGCAYSGAPSYATTGGSEMCAVTEFGVIKAWFSGVSLGCGLYGESRGGWAWYGDSKVWYRQAAAPNTDETAFEPVAVPENCTLLSGHDFPNFLGGTALLSNGLLTVDYEEASFSWVPEKLTDVGPKEVTCAKGTGTFTQVINDYTGVMVSGGYIADGVERFIKGPDGLMTMTYSSVVYSSPFHHPALAAVVAGLPDANTKAQFAAKQAGQDALMLRKQDWLAKNSRDVVTMLINFQIPRGWGRYLREQAPHSRQLTVADESMLPTWEATLLSDEFVYGSLAPNTSFQRVLVTRHTISFAVEHRESAMPPPMGEVEFSDEVLNEDDDPLVRRTFSQVIDGTQTVTRTYSECDEEPGLFVPSTRVDVENWVSGTQNQYGETYSLGIYSEQKSLLDLQTGGLVNIQNGYTESGPDGLYASALRSYTPAPAPKSESISHTTPAIIAQYLQFKNWQYANPAPSLKRWISSRNFSAVDVVLFESAPTDAELGMFGIVSRRDRVRVIGKASIRRDSTADTLSVTKYTPVNRVIDLDMETEVWPVARMTQAQAEAGTFPTFYNALLMYSTPNRGYEDEVLGAEHQACVSPGFRAAILRAVQEAEAA